MTPAGTILVAVTTDHRPPATDHRPPAIGWFGEIATDAADQFGATSPLLYTVRRTAQDT